MHLGDERACRVDHRQLAAAASLTTACDTPCALNIVTAPSGTSFSSSTKRAPLFLQGFDHMLVVNDLMAHIDGRAELLERALDDVDGPHDAGAKAARLCKNYAHQRLPPLRPALQPNRLAPA
jgi:hypothetical protein